MEVLKKNIGDNKNKMINGTFFIILFLVYIFALSWLVYHQIYTENNQYPSDFECYINYLTLQEYDFSYAFTYPVMFWLAKALSLGEDIKKGLFYSVILLSAVTPISLKIYIDCFMKKTNVFSCKNQLISTILVFSLLFCSMLFVDLTHNSVGGRYLGVFSPNPYHNATYLAARGFIVISFFEGVHLYERMYEKISWKRYMFFSINLLLATMTKPSFTLGFGFVMLIAIIASLIKHKLLNIKQVALYGICYIPTIIDLLYQYAGVFKGSNEFVEEKGIGVGFLSAWSTVSDDIGLAIMKGSLFPVLTTIIFRKELKKNVYFLFSSLNFIVNLLMLVFLYEKGYRMSHVNFSWGYMYSLFLVYICSVLVLVKKTFLGNKYRYICAFMWLVYLWHFICGVVYAIPVFQGGNPL